MAKANANPKERDGFLRDLHHFHESRGTPYKRPPVLGGKEVDLFLLYNLVTNQGGWIKVNSKNSWSEILEELKIPKECVNGSVALKQIYLRYLDRWEKVHFLGEEADRGSDDDEESRHKRWSARALHSVPLNYNYNQHIIADVNREYNHLATNLYKSSDYDRLALSLISPLPNEQDFAINVCTLLSNDGKHTLKLEKHPRIIDYLLAHAGVFSHSSLRNLFVHNYSTVRKHPIHNFWRDVVEFEEFLDLTDETLFSSSFNKSVKDVKAAPAPDDPSSSSSSSLSVRNGPSDCSIVEPMDISVSDTCEISDSVSNSDLTIKLFRRITLKSAPSDKELFCLGRGLGTQDYIGQRVLQVATILRNLSFIEENVPCLLQNKTFLRFLLLCSSSRWGYLKNLGLDMLGNLAMDFLVKDYPNDRIAVILLKIVTNGLKSEDRAACISSLEVLNKLSQNELNEEILLRQLDSDVYEKVCSFLTIHDVMLLIYTLECLYSLSSLGERSCNLIVNNHGVVDTLVSLITVEGKSYGPKACIGMKLVETVPGGHGTSSGHSQSNNAPTTTPAVSTAASTVNTTSNNTATSTTVAKINIQSTPVRTVQIAPQRLLTITSSAPTTATTNVTPVQTITPQQLIQQQHAHQQAIHENEQFALAWLRATYEPCVNGRIDHQELYKHYLNSCSKIGRRGVISPLHFPRCVRSVFGGTVGPNPMKPSSANEPQYYEGIKVRAQPLIINIPQPVPSSPVTPSLSTGTTTTTTTAAKGLQLRRSKQASAVVLTAPSPPLTLAADNSSNSNDNPPVSPASPILKAQLSAPPKQRDAAASSTSKGDMKSQVMAHPHLSQALLGTGSAQSTVSPVKENQAGQSNTSLIKSLLATKVNDCMPSTVSMRTATDCQNVAQVAARQQQQRLLAQQINTTPISDASKNAQKSETPKVSRINGARQLFTESSNDIGDPSVSSTTQFTNLTKGKKEPPQPPPPPLAPLSNNTAKKSTSNRIDNEDSDSTGNNSLASSSGMGTIGIGGISSTEDGENSLTSFEGLLNGIPNIDNPLNEDSNSKDSVKVASGEITKNKPLRLADLLEKKVDKNPPILNGNLGKELRLGDKTLDLVENHIEKALSRENDPNEIEKKNNVENEKRQGIKRQATDDILEVDAKKLLVNVNGSASNADSPAPDSVSSSNGDETTATVSTAAAKLFADIAADILEGEDEEQLLQEAQHPPQQATIDTQPVPQVSTPVPQLIVDNNQQVLLTQPRQIIVSQAQQVNKQPQTVIVQNSSPRPQMLLQQNSSGQILLSQGLQGQVQLVASSTNPGQYVLQTSGTQNAYVVAQPQTAVVHGQPQTVLVAQTAQQQGSGTKTIIILQQQPSTATHHQKVMVTPQGQQVVVTQVHRPLLQTSTVSNNIVPTTSVIKTTPVTTTVANVSSNGVAAVVDKKPEEVKPKIIRDLTTPFVCEWGDCNIDTKFKSANQVYLHVCEAHCPRGSEEIVCQWDRCDNMKRKRFSLMTHLHDKHCNTEAMKQSLTRRKQVNQGGKVEPPPPTPATPHPGYAPDAALHAIKRHALEFVNPKELQQKPTPKQGTPIVPAAPPRPGPNPVEQDDNEGPVTKSIRLTASLILRNLVIYSSNCRRYLKHYEPHLANVALSNVESSRTIAQVLYDMNEGSTHR